MDGGGVDEIEAMEQLKPSQKHDMELLKPSQDVFNKDHNGTRCCSETRENHRKPEKRNQSVLVGARNQNVYNMFFSRHLKQALASTYIGETSLDMPAGLIHLALDDATMAKLTGGAVHDGFPSIGSDSTARRLPSNPMGQRYLETMWYHNNFIQHCAQKKLLRCQFGGVARARVSVFHQCATAIV